jgi:outer membrane protein
VTCDREIGLMKIATACLAGLLFVAAGAAAQSAKVGVVNLARIERESPSARRAIEALDAEFAPRNRQLQEFQKEIAAARNRLAKEADTMAPSERDALGREVSGMMQKSDQTLRALKEDYTVRRRELAVKVLLEAQVAIKTVAEAGQYDLILPEAAFARSSVDITDLVLKEMANRAGGR